MTSSYRDPSVMAALAYQAEQEKQRKEQEQPNFLDIAGRTALGLGAATLAGVGIARGLRRNAASPVTVRDLSANAEETVRRAARSSSTPPPSRPSPPAGVARQQAAEEFTRQARAERPGGVRQINLEDPWFTKEQVNVQSVPRAENFTRQVSAEQPEVIQQVSVRDLGPTWRTPSAAENKATLALLNNVVLPTEQALTRPRLPGVTQVDLTEFSPQFRSYGQVPQVAEKVTSEVKALPPARAQSTDFLRNELGSRGYIEQSILDRAAEQSAGDLIDEVTAFSNKEARSELARQAASIQSQERKNLWNLVSEIQNETLVDTQQARTGFNVDQALNALDAAEDQQTGRVKLQLQRNEDLDLGQIEVLEDVAEYNRIQGMEQDEPINRVASQLPDGRPLDQAEGLDLRTGERFAIRQINRELAPKSTLGATGLVPGQKILSEQEPQSVAGTSAVRFMEAERNKIRRELEIDDVPVSPARVDAELAKRLGPKASTYGPKYTARAQALQTFANTGSPIAAETVKRFGLRPVTFETFENMPLEKKRLFESGAPMSLEGYPSTELQTVIDPTGIEVNAPGFGVVDIATLRKPVVMESTARQANEFIEEAKANKLNWVQGKINEIEGARQGILSERKQRIQATANNLLIELEQAKASGQGAAVNELEDQLKNLRMLYKNPELVKDYKEYGEGGMALLNAQRRGVERSTNEQIAALEKRYPTTLANRTGEASRVFGELNVDTGEFIPETMEVRSGRSDADLGRKGGGGRNIAEFTAGERLDEEIRALQGGGRIRDYDPETGAPVQRWQGDNTQVGRTIDEYGIRLTGQRAADPEMRPSVPQYTQQEIEEEALRLSQADVYGDVPTAPKYATVVESLGAKPRTQQGRKSIDVSETIRRLQSSRAPGAQAQLNDYIKSLRANVG